MVRMKTSHVIKGSVNTLPLEQENELSLMLFQTLFKPVPLLFEYIDTPSSGKPYSRTYLHNLSLRTYLHNLTKERKKLIRKRTLTGKLRTKKGTLLASAIEVASNRGKVSLAIGLIGLWDIGLNQRIGSYSARNWTKRKREYKVRLFATRVQMN